jgi:hypothetical protein
MSVLGNNTIANQLIKKLLLITLELKLKVDAGHLVVEFHNFRIFVGFDSQ